MILDGKDGIQNPNLNSSCIVLDRLAPKKDDGPDYCLNYDITKQPKYRKFRRRKKCWFIY